MTDERGWVLEERIKRDPYGREHTYIYPLEDLSYPFEAVPSEQGELLLKFLRNHLLYKGEDA